MIACTICGKTTRVTETRRTPGGTRRRRRCTDSTCDGNLTTIELVVPRPLYGNDAVIVSRRTIEQLQRAVLLLGGPVE
jgi:transcriptional regulator NrdR family protein